MSDPRPPSSIFDIIGDILRQAAIKKAQEAAYGIAGAFGSGQTNLPEGYGVGPLDVGAATNLLTHVTRPDLYGDTTPIPSTAERAGEPGFPLTFPAPLGGNNAPIYDLPVLGGALKQFQYQGVAGAPSPINDLGPIPFAIPETTAAEQTLAALTGKAVGKAGSAVAAAAKPQAVAAAGKDVAKVGAGDEALVISKGQLKSTGLTRAEAEKVMGTEPTGPFKATFQKDGTPAVVDADGKVVRTFAKKTGQAGAEDIGFAAAQADATRRNAPRIAEAITKKNGLEAIPADDPLRKLTSDQLGVLRRVPGVSKADKKAIDALLAERAFTVAPEDQLKLAVNDVPRAIQSQVRKALRSELGDNLTPEELIQAPGMPAVLDEVLAGRKIPVNIANRKALAQELIDKARADNVANLARNAKNLTGDPVTDGVIADLSHVEGDAKAGAPAVQTFEDTMDAIAGPALRGEALGQPDMAAIRAMVAARRTATAAESLTPEQQAARDAVQGAPVFSDAPATKIKARTPTGDVENVAIGRGQQPLLPREGVPGGSPPPGGGGPKLPPTTGAPKPRPEPMGKRLPGAPMAALKAVANAVFKAAGFMANFDLSAAGRNTFPLLSGHPRSWVRGNLDGFLDLFKNEASFKAQQLNLARMIERTGMNAWAKDGGLLREAGGNLVTNEERSAKAAAFREGWFRPIADRLGGVPVLGGVLKGTVETHARFERAFVGAINAVSTYAYLSKVRLQEFLLRRPLTLTEQQEIINGIRIATGRGYQLSETTPELVQAVAKIAASTAWSPQTAAANLRFMYEVPKAVARIAWDAKSLRMPRPQDIEMVRNGLSYAVGAYGIWAMAQSAGLKVDLNFDSARYGLIELGKPSAETAKAAAVAEILGFSTQTFGGKSYLDVGRGIFQDIRLLYRTLGPLVPGGGIWPRKQNGEAWNPYHPKATEDSVFDLYINWTVNRLVPGYGEAVSALQGHQVDWGDPTENPITGSLIPMWIQGTASASGETRPGGALYMKDFPGAISSVEAEKNRLSDNIPPVPGLGALSSDRQKQFSDQVTAAVNARLDAVVRSEAYQSATDAKKKELLATNAEAAGSAAKRSAALTIATTGTPEETLPATAIALSHSSSNLQKGRVLQELEKAGRLTPELATSIDGLRTQTNRAKPGYDPSTAELRTATQLADQWLAAPEFEEGTKADWDQAAVAAAQLRALRADAERRGVDPRDDEQIVRFYDEQGGPLFTEFYTFAGAKKPNAVGEVRKAIQKNPLWSLVAGSMTKLDHPGLP